MFRRFVLYLRNKRGNNEVTINKTIGTIAVYINEAVKKEIIKENPIKSLKLRGALDTTAESLEEQELKKLLSICTINIYLQGQLMMC